MVKTFVFFLSTVLLAGVSLESVAATQRTRTVSQTTTSGNANNRTSTTRQKVYNGNGRQIGDRTTKTTVRRK